MDSLTRKAAEHSGIRLDGTLLSTIAIPPDSPSPVRLAARELRRYLKMAVGVGLELREGGPAAGSFYLSAAADEVRDLGTGFDRCAALACGSCLKIVGENPISVLYGVYEFLEDRLDIRFFAPGHEHVPTREELRIPAGYAMRRGSAFAIRNWVNRTNDREALLFAVKSRINTVLGCGPWNPSLGSASCNAGNAALVRDLGLKLRGPGHNWRSFIPDGRLFETHPEYFPMFGGRRAPNGRTGCFSNPEVRRIFRKNLRAYLREHPYWDIFAFWPEDVNERGYCECPECLRRSSTDWYITLVNDAAEVLAEELPDAWFELIAYHDTRVAPAESARLYRDGEKMLVNFCLGYSRDLFRPLAEGRCGSPEVLAMYRGWCGWLARTGFRGRRMTMEYYNLCEWPDQGPRGRALLWPLEVISEDIRFYRGEGMDGLGAFTGFDCLAWPSPFNLWAWLKLWNAPDLTLAELKGDFYPKYFGPVASPAESYVERLETLMGEPTSPDNIARLRELGRTVADMKAAAVGTPFAERLDVLESHYEQCLLLKETFLAYTGNDAAKTAGLKARFLGFFADRAAPLRRYLAPYPPLWYEGWIPHLENQAAELLKDERIR